MNNNSLITKLSNIVGNQFILTQKIDKLPYTKEYVNQPLAIVFPNNENEITKIISETYKSDVPVITRGSGTSIWKTAFPSISDSIILSTLRMKDIINVNLSNREICVESGISLGEINQYLASSNYFVPPNPINESISTIGGCLVTNVSGIKSIKYGTIGNHVSSINVVVKNGDLISINKNDNNDIGIRSILNSHGSLGVITKIKLNVTPYYKIKKFLSLSFNNLIDLLNCSRDVCLLGLEPSMLGFIDEHTLDKINIHYKLQNDLLKSHLLFIGFESHTNAEINYKINNTKKIVNTFTGKILDLVEENQILEIYRYVFPCLESLNPTPIIFELIHVSKNIKEILNMIEDIKMKFNINIFTFGFDWYGSYFLAIQSENIQNPKLKNDLIILINLINENGGRIHGDLDIIPKKQNNKFFDQILYDTLKLWKTNLDPKNLFNPNNKVWI